MKRSLLIILVVFFFVNCENQAPKNKIKKPPLENDKSQSSYKVPEKINKPVVIPGYIVDKSSSMEISVSEFKPESFLPETTEPIKVYWVDTIRFDFVSDLKLLKRIYIQDLYEKITKKETETLFEYKNKSGETKYVVKTLKIAYHTDKSYNCILYLIDENVEFEGNLGFPK